MIRILKKSILLLTLILSMNGCISNMLSIGETESICDKNTKRLGKCVGISDVMENRHKYANDYIKGKRNEK